MIHLKLLGRTKRKRMRENKGCLWDLWTTRIWGEIWASQKSPNRLNPKRSSLRLSSHWQRCAIWTQQEKRDPSHSRDHPQSISRLLSTNLTGQERVREKSPDVWGREWLRAVVISQRMWQSPRAQECGKIRTLWEAPACWLFQASKKLLCHVFLFCPLCPSLLHPKGGWCRVP